MLLIFSSISVLLNELPKESEKLFAASTAKLINSVPSSNDDAICSSNPAVAASSPTTLSPSIFCGTVSVNCTTVGSPGPAATILPSESVPSVLDCILGVAGAVLNQLSIY